MHDKMKFLPAECIEDGQFIMGESGPMKVLKVEWPYAVVREFSDGSFGRRSYFQLQGRYHIPSSAFLRELGLYRDREEPVYVLMNDDDVDVLPPNDQLR